jgi:hypothetical protein
MFTEVLIYFSFSSHQYFVQNNILSENVCGIWPGRIASRPLLEHVALFSFPSLLEN